MNIIWKGINSDTITGLKILELPPITKPKLRVQEIHIDGVDGSRYEDLGYEPYTKTIKIGLVGSYNIDDIISYFNGDGHLILSNESGKYYKAKIIEKIDFTRLVRFRTAEVKFRVQPFKYDDITKSVTSGTSTVIKNLGNIESKPLIKITGSGTIEIKKNNVAQFTYTFPEGDTEVYIDSDKQDAYVGNVLKNRSMNGEFIKLDTGNNTISWSGTITQIEFSNFSRWL